MYIYIYMYIYMYMYIDGLGIFLRVGPGARESEEEALDPCVVYVSQL